MPARTSDHAAPRTRRGGPMRDQHRSDRAPPGLGGVAPPKPRRRSASRRSPRWDPATRKRGAKILVGSFSEPNDPPEEAHGRDVVVDVRIRRGEFGCRTQVEESAARWDELRRGLCPMLSNALPIRYSVSSVGDASGPASEFASLMLAPARPSYARSTPRCFAIDGEESEERRDDTHRVLVTNRMRKPWLGGLKPK